MTTAARTTREIIRIGDEKCTGCGECVPNCPEGALQIIDGKARLMSDLFCDGLGACIGHCPEGAIEVEEREAEPYDERRVMESIVPHGPNTIRAHLEHLKGHGADAYHAEAVAFLKERGMEIPAGEPVTGCPGCRVRDLGVEDAAPDAAAQDEQAPVASRPSRLRQWPVQLKLVPVTAPYLRGADLVISADCVPFAYADFHEEILKGKVLLVGCPKLDDAGLYEEKLKRIFAENDVRSVTCVHMTVPCCFGLVVLVKEAIAASGRDVPFTDVTVSVKGEIVPPDAPESSGGKGGR